MEVKNKSRQAPARNIHGWEWEKEAQLSLRQEYGLLGEIPSLPLPFGMPLKAMKYKGVAKTFHLANGAGSLALQLCTQSLVKGNAAEGNLT